MIQLGFKTNPRTPINVMDEVTSRMSVGSRSANAEEVADYLQIAMRKISRWEARLIRSEASEAPVSAGFIDAEADALSAQSSSEDRVLECNRRQALGGRAPYDTSWVFNRLLALASSPDSTVWVWEILFDDSRARGRTRVWRRTDDRSGRAVGVQVFVNTTGSAEDKGDTLVHELCIHAWRLGTVWQRLLSDRAGERRGPPSGYAFNSGGDCPGAPRASTGARV
jgi:hypothetical protein